MGIMHKAAFRGTRGRHHVQLSNSSLPTVIVGGSPVTVFLAFLKKIFFILVKYMQHKMQHLNHF